MPRTTRTPTRLADERFFVIRFHRELGRYELLIPSTAASYDLGDRRQADQYFWSIGMEALGARACDAAFNFGASQADVLENRAYGLDLTRSSLDEITRKRDRQLTHARMFGEDPEDEDEVVL